MKILFLDIDGVSNCASTVQRHRGVIGIDPVLSARVVKIVRDADCEVVLSSTWRLTADAREEVSKKVCKFIDVTPDLLTDRGCEIQAWLSHHPEVTRYAILDDSTDFHPDQPLFRTTWESGLTEDIAAEVVAYLNDTSQASPTEPVLQDGKASERKCPTCGRTHYTSWDDAGNCITCVRDRVLGGPTEPSKDYTAHANHEYEPTLCLTCAQRRIEELEENQVRGQQQSKVRDLAIKWLLGGDTGISSESLCAHMLGVEKNDSFGMGAPSDSADRGRCIRLLNFIPEWWDRLDEMAQYPSREHISWSQEGKKVTYDGWAEQIPLIRKEAGR